MSETKGRYQVTENNANTSVLVIHRPDGLAGGDIEIARDFAEALKEIGVFADMARASDNLPYDDYDIVHMVAAVDTKWGLQTAVNLSRMKKHFTVTPLYFPRDERHEFFSEGNDVYPGYKTDIQYTLQLSSAMACINMSELMTCWEFIGYHPGFVMGNGFNPPETPENINKQDYVICLARVEPHKNQAMLARACLALNVDLVVAGAIANEDYARMVAAKKMLGQVSYPKAMELLASARVHALPSFGECISRATSEAQYFGVPTVTGIGHDWEYFKDRSEYCNPADWRSIAHAVERAWNREIEPWDYQPEWSNVALKWLEYVKNNGLISENEAK